MNKDKMPEVFRKFIKILKKNQYVLIVLIVGLIILLLPTGSKSNTEKKTQTTEVQSSLNFSVEEMEDKIANALSEIEGAGEVTVVLTLKTSMEQEVAVDKDDSGGETNVTVSDGSGNESPLTIKYKYPEYQGALVVAKGADNAGVKLQITKAVSSLTGLSTDKISVINKEN